jgi:hypothetical protein
VVVTRFLVEVMQESKFVQLQQFSDAVTSGGDAVVVE